jgi:elongation factor Ts
MADLNLVKKLREATGCGISDCNRALAEVNYDFENAVDWLRKKGLSSAGKKSGRATSEGLSAVFISDCQKKASIIEVNSETDFVARNQKFQDFVALLAQSSLPFKNDVEKFKSSQMQSNSHSVGDEVKNQIAVIGENINLRRIDCLQVNSGAVISYIHNSVAKNMGKIAVLLALESSVANEKLQEVGKQIAMHIAATKPDFLDIASVDKEKLSRETEILKEQARSSGKPEGIIEKMIDGRIRKYYEEVVLLEQTFVMDDKLKVKDVVANFAKQNGDTKITGFKLFVLGEGL